MRTIVPESLRRAALGMCGALLVVSFVVTALPGCVASRGTVGAVIAQEPDTGRLFLRDVPPGLAASRAGLKPGDEVLLIDGVDVRAMDAKQIHATLTGDIDPPVKLTIVRGDQILRVTLKRTEAQKLKLPPTNAPEAQH